MLAADATWSALTACSRWWARELARRQATLCNRRVIANTSCRVLVYFKRAIDATKRNNPILSSCSITFILAHTWCGREGHRLWGRSSLGYGITPSKALLSKQQSQCILLVRLSNKLSPFSFNGFTLVQWPRSNLLIISLIITYFLLQASIFFLKELLCTKCHRTISKMST